MLSPFSQSCYFFYSFDLECHFNICTCAESFSWTTDVCKRHPECCLNNQSCADVLPGDMCLNKNSGNIDCAQFHSTVPYTTYPQLNVYAYVVVFS